MWIAPLLADSAQHPGQGTHGAVCSMGTGCAIQADCQEGIGGFGNGAGNDTGTPDGAAMHADELDVIFGVGGAKDAGWWGTFVAKTALDKEGQLKVTDQHRADLKACLDSLHSLLKRQTRTINIATQPTPSCEPEMHFYLFEQV